jgi:hypothetical protein
MITRAAIRLDNALYLGFRHDSIIQDMIETIRVLPIRFDLADMGFVNHKMKFLNRTAAAKEALKCGQVKGSVVANGKLYRDDVWGTDGEPHVKDPKRIKKTKSVA